MRVLVAIEAATDIGSVAIGDERGLIGELTVGMRTRHAESLLPGLQYLLQSAGVERQDIAGVVVGAGPGSFTGVRIAAATARGLAHGLNVPLYAYSSLAALAASAGVAGLVCPLFDARRGEVYGACYEMDGWEVRRTVLQPAALTATEIADRIREYAPHFVGEGAVRYAAELGIAAPPPLLPRAAALLWLAHNDRTEGGRVELTAGWEPDYLRASGAELGVAG
jgi:tRNA threonylcarbamoyladenosine biosynthesis protein TsaB